jgi:hypothetical protein
MEKIKSVWYQDELGNKYPAVFLGRTQEGAFLLTTVNEVSTIVKRIPLQEEAEPGQPCWTYDIR